MSFGNGDTAPEVDSLVSAERPLTARSVLASTLLGVEPPQLPARVLVRSGELFGIAEGTTRVALSRMVAAGELIAEGGSYRLAGDLVTRQARQIASRAGSTRRWHGRWVLAVVVADDRTAADRNSLRTSATALRLAERRPGVWLRPDNLTAAHGDALAHATRVVDAQCDVFDVVPRGDQRELAATLWDLTGWAQRARSLLAGLAELRPGLDDATTSRSDGSSRTAGSLGPSFVLSAAALRHFQADPLLPSELTPADWPGDQLRRTYEDFDAAFKAAWRSWFRQHH